MKPQKLPRAIIKKELVVLTGDFKKAILLQQMIYWSERVMDYDSFIMEERARSIQNGVDTNVELCNGWIYKTSEDLSEETMLGLSPKNIRIHLKKLIEMGYLIERKNPKYKWDRTLQYRVDIIKIQRDLKKLGYSLDDYPLFETNIQENETNIHKTQNEQAIPETTTETTIKTTIDLKREGKKTARLKNNNGLRESCSKYGTCSNVYLKDSEVSKLNEQFGKRVIDDYIDSLSEYMVNKSKQDEYADHNLTIRQWMRRDKVRKLSEIEAQKKETAKPKWDESDMQPEVDLGVPDDLDMDNLPF